MKFCCPKCETIIFETAPIDNKHWGLLSQYSDFKIEYEDDKEFVRCRNKNCAEKFDIRFFDYEGVPSFHVLGLSGNIE